MEVFVTSVPFHATRMQLEDAVRQPLSRYGIRRYYVDKAAGKGFANITVSNTLAGSRFLAIHGVAAHARGARPVEQLLFQGRPVRFTLSNREPDSWTLEALRLEEDALAAKREVASNNIVTSNAAQQTRYPVRGMQCGTWDFRHTDGRLVFNTYYTDRCREGAVIIGKQEALVILESGDGFQHHVRFFYHQCDNITFGDTSEPGIYFTFSILPKFYKVETEDVLASRMAAMGILGTKSTAKSKQRVTSVDEEHSKFVGTSMVYRVRLANHAHFNKIAPLLKAMPRVAPKLVNTHVVTSSPRETPTDSFSRLYYELSDVNRSGHLPFAILFQVEKLARNGIIPPRKVMALLGCVAILHKSAGQDATATALQQISKQLKPAGHDFEMTAEAYTVQSLEKRLQQFAAVYDHSVVQKKYELAKRISHIKLIHRIIVTPTTIRLTGPEPEPTNRVLRRYEDNPDCLVRVVFQDEDGGPVRYDGRVDQHAIYHDRFKRVLDKNITVASRAFHFLGFSHSSLRSQACWFMSPIAREGSLFYAQHIVKELGDFTNIKIPAKCAARIGQNFTDTNASIDVDFSKEVGGLLPVERNGYDFSDGVGTISQKMLEKVWKKYGAQRHINPTILQIRYKGAKGVVSLDSRLQGSRLLLRESMVKFESKGATNLEICGAASKPLSMYLNRGLIKILEDLDVPKERFLTLQKAAFDKLRAMTSDGSRAAKLLEDKTGTRSTRMPGMLRMLHEIGLEYYQDEFLFKTVEIAVVSSLRELKYRGRIPVESGATLFGIMDETGTLKEGEVFVIFAKLPGGTKEVLVKNHIVITRSPALHPGDVQIVNAVNVPTDSPLQDLHNVVVFSQFGDRDLPSQLSGGDLDGDTYHVVWEDKLIPQYTVTAAGYPRMRPVELDREVTQSDMSDFFVTFMETDQLGMISNIHLQLADTEPEGTHSRGCKTLANMASIAVDYSKTGIPVNMGDCPKYKRVRPDYMAQSPRLIINSEGLDIEEDDNATDRAFDDIDADRRPFRYYPSQKALGHLYRAIDENQFLIEMKQDKKHATALTTGTDSLMSRLWEYLQSQAHDLGVTFSHHLDFAADIQTSYHDNLKNVLDVYSPSPHSPLSEIEVFSGNILGRQGGVQGKALRELSNSMREEFERVCTYVVQRIIRGDEGGNNPAAATPAHDGDGGDENELLDEFDPMALYAYDEREVEALPRALACLQVAMSEDGGRYFGRFGSLESFGYLAAGVALREWERYRTGVGLVGALPMA